MINLDKPTTGTPQTELNIGSGYNLLIGGIYKLIVGAAAIASSMTNLTKVSIGETWATVTTTWATEPETWEAASQLLTNTTKQSSSISNQAKP